MSNNRVIFDEAREQSRAAAARGDWYAAVDAALRATTACPDDLDARSELATALYHTAQYAQAITALEAVRAQRSDDLLTLAYLARAYEGDGQADKAVQTLLMLGQHATTQQLLNDALDAFEEAVRLAPKAEQPRIHMAEVLVALGDTARAADQCVVIAQQRRAAGNLAGAREALDEALELDPANHAARTLQSELLQPSPAPIPQPADRTGITPPPAQSAHPQDRGRAEQLALQALTHQRAGDDATALRLYKEAIDTGAERADVWYNLALLHQKLEQHDMAVTLFQKAARSPEYALRASHALGKAFRSIGDLAAAADAYEAALQHVNLATLNRAEANDIVAVYRDITDVYAELGDFSRAAALSDALANALQHKRWGRELADQQRARAKQFTQQLMTNRLQRLGTEPLPSEPAWSKQRSLDTLLRTDSLPEAAADSFALFDTMMPQREHLFASVTPIDTAGSDETTARLVDASGRFIEQGLVWAALDACYEVIRHDPAFLPVHLRLGEIYERQGRAEDALIKYRTLVDTYIARSCPSDAVAVYDRMIELAPDDVDARTQLVELLRATGRTDAAVTQAIMVANTYFRLGQTSRALTEFETTHAWAAPSAALHIEHGRALLKLERWDAAYTHFQQAVSLAPQNPVALALQSLALAVLDQPIPTLWDSFASLLDRLADDPQQHAAVQAEYRAALMLVDRPMLHYLLGLLQQAAQQHDMALLSFEQALNLLMMEEAPSIAPLLVHQAMVTSYVADGQLQNALDHLYTVQRLRNEQPPTTLSPHAIARPLSSAEIQRMLAAIHRQLGDDAAADALTAQDAPPDAERLASISDHDHAASEVEGLLALADANAAQQQFGAAIETLQHAKQLAPGDVRVCERLARLHLRRGDAAQGLALLETVAHLHREATHIEQALATLYQAAECYWMLGHLEEARRLYDQGSTWAPQHLDVWQQRVHFALLTGRIDHAIAAQRQVVHVAEQDQHVVLPGSVQQLLALAPNDAEVQQLYQQMDVSSTQRA